MPSLCGVMVIFFGSSRDGICFMMMLFTIGILKVTQDRQAQGKEEDKVKVNMKDI
jgi:MFS-type transporter involved in bile tolerance (Atg22 family)